MSRPDYESTNVEAAAYLAREADAYDDDRPTRDEYMDDAADGCQCAGHEWWPAGGGLLICGRCEAEQWEGE